MSLGTAPRPPLPSEGCGGRTGYRQQPAHAVMAAARQPRPGGGFPQPGRSATTPGSASAHDLHAWPELFFSGSGWVRFGRLPPVPAGFRRTPAKRSTSGNHAHGPLPAPGPRLPRESNDASRFSARGKAVASRERWVPSVWVAVALLLVLALAVALGLVRAPGAAAPRGLLGPEEAWLEIRDTTIDLPPAHRSPWQTCESLSSWRPRDECARRSAPPRPRHQP